MEAHFTLAQYYTASLTARRGSRGITAFSALPDAPVLPVRQSRVRTAIAAIVDPTRWSRPEPRRVSARLHRADA